MLERGHRRRVARSLLAEVGRDRVRRHELRQQEHDGRDPDQQEQERANRRATKRTRPGARPKRGPGASEIAVGAVVNGRPIVPTRRQPELAGYARASSTSEASVSRNAAPRRAVHHAMIERHGQLQHRPHRRLSVDRHDPIDDAADGEDWQPAGR